MEIATRVQCGQASSDKMKARLLGHAESTNNMKISVEFEGRGDDSDTNRVSVWITREQTEELIRDLELLLILSSKQDLTELITGDKS